MDKIADIILRYESDTFDAGALGVTRKEARQMAARLFMRLCKVVEEGGQLRCDGDVLSSMLDDVRGQS